MDGLTRLRLAIMAATLACAGLSAQVPSITSLQTGNATISGRVVDARTGEPLGNVMVGLTAPRILSVLSATTDDSGRYRFTNLAEHEYSLRVMDPLYLQSCYGATDPAQLMCGTVNLLRDQQQTGIDFRLTLGAILRGRVVDHAGNGVGGATVHASLAPSMLPAYSLPASAQTKPDGTFEIRGLTAGETVLSLDMPVTADRPRAPSVFYPGVERVGDAEAIRVSAGLVTSGIVFKYPEIAARSLTARISAPATGASGLKVWLYRVEPRMSRAMVIDAHGAGSVTGLLEGRYYVAAQAQGESEPLMAFEVAEVLHDSVELALLLQEPGRITGRVVADKGGLPPLADVRVAAKWTDDGEEINPLAADDVAAGPDGSFRIDGVFGLRSVQLLGLSPEWQVQSIRHGRNEIATSGIFVPPGATLDIVVTVARR